MIEDFKELAESRRSATFFDSNKKIPDKTLRNIINLAVLTPSSMNSQPWEVIAIKSDEKRKELYEKACKQAKVLEAPVTLAIVGKIAGYSRDNPIWEVKKELRNLSEESIEKMISRVEKMTYPSEIKKYAYAIRNSSLFAMSIMYSAKYYEVDSHPMIGFKEEKVKEMFDLGEDKTVIMLITLGYFNQDKKLYPREKRFGYDEIVTEY